MAVHPFSLWKRISPLVIEVRYYQYRIYRLHFLINSAGCIVTSQHYLTDFPVRQGGTSVFLSGGSDVYSTSVSRRDAPDTFLSATQTTSVLSGESCSYTTSPGLLHSCGTFTARRGLLTPPAIWQSVPALFPLTVLCDTALSSVKALTAVNTVSGLRRFLCRYCVLTLLPVEYPIAVHSLLPPVWPRSLLPFAIASVCAEAV